jgi:hypothetical protein
MEVADCRSTSSAVRSTLFSGEGGGFAVQLVALVLPVVVVAVLVTLLISITIPRL